MTGMARKVDWEGNTRLDASAHASGNLGQTDAKDDMSPL